MSTNFKAKMLHFQRYIAFAGSKKQPHGGFNDFVSSYASLEDVRQNVIDDAMKRLEGPVSHGVYFRDTDYLVPDYAKQAPAVIDWIQVVDTTTSLGIVLRVDVPDTQADAVKEFRKVADAVLTLKVLPVEGDGDFGDITDPCELVGDLSEGILLCSYNEHQIRPLWAEGKLNEAYQEEMQSSNKDRCKLNLAHYKCLGDDFQRLLTLSVARAGGWPANYVHSPLSLSPLTDQELALIAAL